MALTQERLKELLTYSPETGLFYWVKRTSNRAHAGAAGCHCQRSRYILIGIDGNVYPAHRLAWLFMHGAFPADEIDHINGVRADNRWVNLRECAHAQNLKNMKRPSHNTSGLKGVHFHRATGKWRARIKSDGKHHSLGLHSTKEQAHAAYRDGAARLHGDFARFQ